MKSITLTKAQEDSIMSEAVASLVAHLITQHRGNLDFISPAQAGGILDVGPATLRSLKIPRYQLVAGQIVKYRLGEVIDFLHSTKL